MALSIFSEFVDFAQLLAEASREMLIAASDQVPEVVIKADASQVTETDRAIEARLREMIANRFPGHGIIGEELGQHGTNLEFVWVLDPIDGTAPFIAGLPIYGTLIGLAHGGRPLLGIIDHPATDDRWLGVVGEGASHNGAAQSTRPCPNLGTAFATNSNPDFMVRDEYERFKRIRDRVQYMQYGGSCYAYGLLASGRTDLALDAGLEIHDILAIAAVIESAGGIITDWDGNGIDLSWQGRVVAAGDPGLHGDALALLAGADEPLENSTTVIEGQIL